MKFAQAFSLVLISAASGAWITVLLYGQEVPHTKSIEDVSYNDTSTATEKAAPPTGENCLTVLSVPESKKEQEPPIKKSSNEGHPNEPQPPKMSLDQLRHQEAQVKSFRENIAAIEGESPLQAVKREYQSQPVDYQWAIQKEEQLLSLFESQASLSKYAPLDVSCKSETCQVVMAAETAQQGKAIYDAFLNANNQQASGKTNTSISYFNDPENGQLVMYTSERGVQALFGQ